jgi:hypothetical protein
VTLEIFDSGAAALRLGSSIVLTFAIDTTSGEIKSPKVNSKALAKFIKAIEWLS